MHPCETLTGIRMLMHSSPIRQVPGVGEFSAARIDRDSYFAVWLNVSIVASTQTKKCGSNGNDAVVIHQRGQSQGSHRPRCKIIKNVVLLYIALEHTIS